MFQILAKVLNVTCDHMNNRSLAFQFVFDFEQAPLDDSGAIVFKDTSPDHHVNVVGFILELR